MSRWLVQMSFGPVQSFISSARRSRDLWAGSRLLSEIVRGGAQSLLHLSKGSGHSPLIYPTAQAVELTEGVSAGNLSNEVLAVIEAADEDALRQIVLHAQEAGQSVLHDISTAEQAKWRAALGNAWLRGTLWDAQVAQAFVFSAAWVKHDDTAYSSQIKALKRIMAARKGSAMFAPHSLPESLANEGIPKSWLDGINESVLPEKNTGAVDRFDLGEDEQLDALGCIKRSYGQSEQFTALTRLAAHSWLASILASMDEPDRKALKETYEDLCNLGYATRCDGNQECYAQFPYDAGLFFGGALAEARARTKRKAEKPAIDALAELHRLMGRIKTRPNPYVALLYADGDGMGKFLGVAQTREQHALISEAIADFSAQVPALARASDSHAIYHGGDDVMVACVLPTAIKCARDLAKAFADRMQTLVRMLAQVGASVDGIVPPTLRVGVAICHIMEPMNFIRHSAKQAEALAKGDIHGRARGNALGLRLDMRSGPIVEARLGFGTIGADADDFASMETWIEAYSDEKRRLPARTAFDIFQVSERLSGLQLALAAEDAAAAERSCGLNPELNIRRIGEAEFKRVIARSRESGGDRAIADDLRGALLSRLDHLRPRHGDDLAMAMRMLGNELILARWLTAAGDHQLPEHGGDA